MPDILRNGAIVLMRKPLPDKLGYQPAEIVFCHIPHNSVTPYVTWQRNTEEDSTYWGHYFESYYKANSDFEERCKEKHAL